MQPCKSMKAQNICLYILWQIFIYGMHWITTSFSCSATNHPYNVICSTKEVQQEQQYISVSAENHNVIIVSLICFYTMEDDSYISLHVVTGQCNNLFSAGWWSLFCADKAKSALFSESEMNCAHTWDLATKPLLTTLRIGFFARNLRLTLVWDLLDCAPMYLSNTTSTLAAPWLREDPVIFTVLL